MARSFSSVVIWSSGRMASLGVTLGDPLFRARIKAAKDVRFGSGVATLRQCLLAGSIDEMHLAISPVFLGQGENLFAGLALPKLGYQRTEHVPSGSATHVVFTKRAL